MSALTIERLSDPRRRLLEQVLEREDRSAGLAADPLSRVHRFSDPADQQAAAWLCALLAYGRVASILASLDDLFARMPDGPGTFLTNFDLRRDGRRLDGFVHRWTQGEDLARALAATRSLIDRHGSLEAAFAHGDDPATTDASPALTSFSTALLQAAPDGPRDRALRWLLPRFGGGSAAKRMCLFLRWMVRPADGLDLGLWSAPLAARLVVPLDTHVFRLGSYLGFTDRKNADARAALEVTEGLRRLDGRDPLRYDFALSHLGILGHCPSRPDPLLCEPCPLRPACRCWSAGAMNAPSGSRRPTC